MEAHKVWLSRDNTKKNYENIFENSNGKHVWFWDEAWYTKEQLEHLLNLNNDNINKLLNNPLIPETLYSKCYNTSGCNISHIYMYNIVTTEYKNVEDIGDILEFGGGYGNMCRCFFHSGFKNKYYLRDLPNQINIQKSYLKKCNIEPEQLYFNVENYKIDCFIASWSLSETPISLRDEFLSKLDANFIFIGFQHKFREVDNLHYFKNYISKNNNYDWKLMKWFGDRNSVLIGKKRL